MNNISLKYRIALIILMLEAVMVTFVLWRVQAVSFYEITSTLHRQHGIYLDLLSDPGRTAFVTTEYGELQQIVDKYKKLALLNTIYFTDHRKIIVASSDHGLLGKVLPVYANDAIGHWEKRDIALESGGGSIGSIHIKFSNSLIHAAHRKSLIQGVTTAGISMGVIAFAGLMIGYLLVRRLDKLNDAARKMSEGNLDTRVNIAGADEVAQLCATFNVMAQKIQLSMDSLKQSEKGLQEAQHIAHLGSWQWTVATDTVKWSEELYRINGLDPKLPPPCYAEMSSCYTPGSWKRLSEAVAEALQSGASYELDLEIVRPDGSTRHTATKGEAEYDANGKVVGLQGTVQDITERKDAEQRQERSLKEKTVMLKEIHHRVKNNLTVVYSLLDLQAKGTADEAVRVKFEESRNRVLSMALIHQTLYQSEDLAYIDYKAYLQNLVGSIAETYNRREVTISVDMEPVTLDVNVGIPCGLIVNELVSNCMKYAFPEGGKGRIRVGININSEGNYVLFVEDNGIGLPTDIDFRNTKSLGLQIVNGLTAQIRGKIELSREGGTRFSIIFPAAPDNGGVSNG